MNWYVYVIYSLKTGNLYTGISTDPERRLREHNGQVKGGAKATRAGRPWVLARVEPARTKSGALRREASIKMMQRQDKLLLVGMSA